MTKFVFVRHGQSMANLERIFAGAYDVELSPTGHMQAEKTAEYIASRYKIDKIYASDLKRAFVTGKYAADKLNMAIAPEPMLREISAGKWEGRLFDDIDREYAEDYRVWKTDIGNAVCTDGESVKQLGKRVSGILNKIAEENPAQTVLIATHATPIRVLECLWRGLPLDEMKNIPWVSNASVTVAEYENGRANFITVGEDSHLDAMRTKLPANV